MIFSKKHTVYLYSLLFFISNSFGQISNNDVASIDALFSSWDDSNHPGGAVLITQKGKTVFSKAYGLSNIAFRQDNTTETRFNIGSVSKQFTAMGIVLLAMQNKLSLNDPVVKYLPKFPDFGYPITIGNLLQHTSGLRDFHGLLALAGWKRSDKETNEDVFRLIERQKELNFRPGMEFLYAGTGYVLAVKIIEHITKKNFDQWMQENIFMPLGMNDTTIGLARSNISQCASSYYGSNKFEKAHAYWGYSGAGNMYSTTKDLNAWLQQFSTPKKEWEKAFEQLLETATLHNGHRTNYGLGVRIDSLFGKQMVQHGGAVGGYRAIVRSFPEMQINIVILSNFSGSNLGSKAEGISKLLIKDSNLNKVHQRKNKYQQGDRFIKLPTKMLKQLEGIYWSNEEKIGRKIYVQHDTLRYESSREHSWPLVPLDSTLFQLIIPGSEGTTVLFDSTTKKMIVGNDQAVPGVFSYLQSHLEKRNTYLKLLVGHYYSEALQTSYYISVIGSDVYIEHARHGKIQLTQEYDTVFSGNWPIRTLEVKIDKSGTVQGIHISNGRTRNVWFKKMNG